MQNTQKMVRSLSVSLARHRYIRVYLTRTRKMLRTCPATCASKITPHTHPSERTYTRRRTSLPPNWRTRTTSEIDRLECRSHANVCARTRKSVACVRVCDISFTANARPTGGRTRRRWQQRRRPHATPPQRVHMIILRTARGRGRTGTLRFVHEMYETI